MAHGGVGGLLHGRGRHVADGDAWRCETHRAITGMVLAVAGGSPRDMFWPGGQIKAGTCPCPGGRLPMGPTGRQGGDDGGQGGGGGCLPGPQATGPSWNGSQPGHSAPSSSLPTPSAQGRMGWGVRGRLSKKSWSPHQTRKQGGQPPNRQETPQGFGREDHPAQPRRPWMKDRAPAGEVERHRGPALPAGMRPRDTPARKAPGLPAGRQWGGHCQI